MNEVGSIEASIISGYSIRNATDVYVEYNPSVNVSYVACAPLQSDVDAGAVYHIRLHRRSF